MSRAYLFENGERADGKLFANQGFEWVADGISSELDNESMQDMCYQEVGLARFEAVALATRSSPATSATSRKPSARSSTRRASARC